MSEELKAAIRTRYGAVASAVAQTGSCCAPAGAASGCCGDGADSEITRDLYDAIQVEELPDAAVMASLGCGNPTALAQLLPGEVVLDLGSGGGIDVLLSAKRVGPTGKAYGLDMTDEMLALARANQRKAGAQNVEFVKGDIEAIPLPDAHVDVIISNCVINLAADKDKVLREAFRTLKPGGRLAVSDVVFQGDLALIPPDLHRQLAAWTGCIAGALEERDYIARLQAAGFTDVSTEVTRVYGDSVADARLPAGIRLVSGFVRARKPGA